jgi:chorismate mutase
MTGISRSAFYKYRDAILPFQNRTMAQIITFQLLVHDAPGALSGILNMLANFGANIQTINSILPSNSCALVTISADTSELTIALEDLLHSLAEAPHVIKAEVLAG